MGQQHSISSPEDMEKIRSTVLQLIQNNKIIVFSKEYCPYCHKAINALKKVTGDYKLIELTSHPDSSQIQQVLGEITGATTVPRVFINGVCIGGGDETDKLFKSGKLAQLVSA